MELKYNNWGQLPVGTYIKCKAIVNDESLDEVDKNVKLISLFTDIDEDIVWSCSLGEINDIVTKLGSMTMPTKYASNLKTINIDGTTYMVSQDLSKFTYAQFVDFQTYIKMGDEYLANMLACFVIPKGKKYNIDYDPNEVAKIFNEKLAINSANACTVFFSQKLLSSTDKTLDSLENTMMKMNKKEKDKTVKMKITEAITGLKQMRQSFGSIFSIQ